MAAINKYSRYYTYIEPLAKNPVIRSYSPFTFSLVMVTVLALFALRPTIKEILNLRSEVESNQKLLQSVQDKTATIQQGQKNLDNLDADKKSKIQTLLPDDPNVTNLVSSLQSMVPQGASISALSVEPVTLLDTTASSSSNFALQKIDFSFSVAAPYETIIQLLQNLHTPPRLVNIQTVHVNSTDKGALTVSVVGESYFVK